MQIAILIIGLRDPTKLYGFLLCRERSINHDLHVQSVLIAVLAISENLGRFGITNRFFCQQPCLIVLIVRISKLPAEFVVLNFPFQKIILIRKDCHLALANNQIFSNPLYFPALFIILIMKRRQIMIRLI